MHFLNCILYLALSGIAAFLLGRVLPKHLFHPEAFPYRCLPFEREGKIYEKLHIRSWQNRVPDMSKILPFMMPPKNITANFRDRFPEMLRETCVAELIHVLLCLSGFYCLRIWPGLGGAVIAAAFFLGNLPFVMIQRFNRPRLLRAYRKAMKGGCLIESVDLKL